MNPRRPPGPASTCPEKEYAFFEVAPRVWPQGATWTDKEAQPPFPICCVDQVRLPAPICSWLTTGVPICLRLSSPRPSPTKLGSQQQRPSSPNPSASLDSYSHLCDQRLNHIRILSWTQVPISNDLAARLISFYLTVDHPILGLFDADLFLGDLVAHKTEFCCPLLLSAVLSFACVCRQDSNPPPLSLSPTPCPDVPQDSGNANNDPFLPNSKDTRTSMPTRRL